MLLATKAVKRDWCVSIRLDRQTIDKPTNFTNNRPTKDGSKCTNQVLKSSQPIQVLNQITAPSKRIDISEKFTLTVNFHYLPMIETSKPNEVSPHIVPGGICRGHRSY